MRKLSLILGVMLCFLQVWSQKNPHGQNFKLNCSDCHTAKGWKYSVSNSTFNHNTTKFKLEGQHKVTSCAACHKSFVFSEVKTNCSDCHTDMHNATVGLDCARCHNAKSWLISNITEIHQQSRFPLLGAHNTADCASCHKSVSKLEFKPLGIECVDCHRSDYEATTNPNHTQTGLSTNCSECHKVEAFEWKSTGYNHDFFPLTKGHSIPKCTDCHVSGNYNPISNDCFSCHEKNFNAATNPSHKKQGFSANCKECHTTDFDWKPAKFGIHDNGYFPIYSGTHRGKWESCTDCHKQTDNFSVFSCIDCHEHNKSKMDEEHKGHNGYSYTSQACFACHALGDKKGAFNHNNTVFPLTGAHIATECTACHKGTYAGTPSECNACHNKNYTAAVNPVHTTAGISIDCKTCHGTSAWTPSSFNHTATGGFELSGGHSGRQCAQCHKGNTTTASPECVSCHQPNYNTALNHVAQKFPLTCSQCHNTKDWKQSTFNHNTTHFPLTGAHVATECAACHKGTYAGTPSECNACHSKNYNAAQNPVHTTAGISTDCKTCHGTSAWAPSSFNHTATSGFELSGGHSGRQCTQCHKGNTTSASPECVSCHQVNYNNALNHVAQKFPLTCSQCHNTKDWKQNTFNHNTTQFPLTGAHVATECAACHKGIYTGTPTACNACHQPDFTKSTNPNHTSLGLSTECQLCHTTNTGWEPAKFPNHQQYFAFNGAHVAIASNCILCHKGNYITTPRTCSGCHMTDYSNTKNPAHAVAQFPIDCEACHSETAWTPSTFKHDVQYFPIYSGKHLGKWSKCSECHTQPSNYSVFSCIVCHEHNKTDMDKKHSGRTGYAYNSVNCLACHPRGN
jgi:hypothetical protein